MNAAVSVVEGSLGSVLEKLQLLAAECSRIRGLGKQIGFLRSELAAMHALLQKVSAMEEDLVDVQVKAWAREVREMAYDVEDCVDSFSSRQRLAAGGNGGGRIRELFGRCARFLQTIRSWRQFADQIDALKSRAVEVADRRERYKLDDLACGSSSRSGVDPRLSALFADEDHLVGIDGPRDMLVRWLMEEGGPAKHPKVLSIVGFGGLGKTTLANQVYVRIGGDFVCKAFFSVSQKPNLKQILRDCMLQLCHEREFIKDIGEWDEKKIITKMREYLADKSRRRPAFGSPSPASGRPQLRPRPSPVSAAPPAAASSSTPGGRPPSQQQYWSAVSTHHQASASSSYRYLIVVDDVWSTSAWDAIKCAFPKNTCSSRIITTTRIVDVAGSCCSCMDDWVYEMEPLNNHYSKRLFLKRIFGSEECHIQFQEVSDEILKKCGGLPLAIISISSLLANKPAVKEEWEKVKNSIGSALERHRNLDGIKTILTLSYNDLSHHLKTCLLYLSLFPEDCNIERSRLVNRWIAEGFIPQERGQSLQDVAECYFYELINKSMVQPIDIGYDGKARSCRIHDIMLELIISKATEENFITIIGSQASIAYPQGNIRRLSFQQAGPGVESILGVKDVSHARSLTAVGLVKYLPRLVQFEVLRVLDFEGCTGLEEYDLNNIDKLTQLRYLSLRDTWISKVPSEIVKLYDLHTLDLSKTIIVELPVGIVHLTKLQNLLISEYNVKVPDGIGNMRNLQVLSGFNIGMSSVTAVEDVSKLTSLKELHIHLNAEGYDKNKRHEEVLLSTLCKLGSCKLQYLRIYSRSSPMEFLDSWTPLPCSLQRFWMTTSYYFRKIPKWIAPALTSLVYLNINLLEVTDVDLRILGELHALLSLELWFKIDQKERLTVDRRGFQCLKEFNFIGGEGYLVFDAGALPKLEKLKLPFSVPMAKGRGFYLGIEHLPCLKYADVYLGNKGAISSERIAAAAAITNEANAHPNHPWVIIF